MEVKIRNIELFKKILKINYPYKPKIINFSFSEDGGIIQFEERKKFSKEEKEIIKAGYANYGLYFSSEDLLFPDIISEPKEIKVGNSKNYTFFFWEENFPRKWKEYLKKPIFLFFPDKKLKGFTSISKYFEIETLLLGKKVFYFNIKDNLKDPYSSFLKIKGNKIYDLYIFDHISFAPPASFEKFLFFILKSPWEGYEILATQWPGRALPEEFLIDFPSYSFSDLLKIFCFPELEREAYLDLIEEYSYKFGYFPGNLVSEFKKNLGFKEEKQKSKVYNLIFDKEKIEGSLKNGKLFDVYPFIYDLKKDKKLYSYFLAWQGDWETLLLILKEPEDDLIPVLFFFAWDGILNYEKIKKFLPQDLYSLFTDRKKGLIKKLKELIDDNNILYFYLKLIYADKIFSSGLKEGEDIFEEFLKEKDKLDDFELAQLNRYLSYYYFYKGDLEEAVQHNLNWAKISEENGWLWQMPLAYNDLSVLYEEKKDYEKAKRSLETAYNFSIFLSEKRKEEMILFNLGVIYSHLKELNKAKKIFKKLEESFRENKDNFSLIYVLFEIFRINYLEGEIEKSLKIIKELENLLEEIPQHPRYFQFFLLKTKLSLWLSKEDYKKSLKFLKDFENFPPHLDEERKKLLSKGAIRGFINFKILDLDIIDIERKIKEGKTDNVSFSINSIEEAIEFLEIKFFYPENFPEKLFKEIISYLENKGIKKWREIFLKEKETIPLFIFKSFEEELPFPYKIILEDGTIIENGDSQNFLEISFSDEIFLYIPEEIFQMYPREIWQCWVYGIAYKKKKILKSLEKIPRDLECFNGFYYSSYKMKKIIEKAKRLAKSDVPIHIFGETGTGKEILAKAIHQESKRFYGPFIPVNCSAIPENLFESEFFGWKKGAFTGALMDRPGFFEQADKGTLFLDEIGELPLNLQAKLLRVLQEKEVQRLGDFKRKMVDFRLITATNKDLKKLVEEKKFREDLYFRIMVSQIYLPPLKDRVEEIIPLANLIIEKNLANFGIKSFKIDPLFFKGLEVKEWKGNTRELENYIISVLANLEEGGTLTFKEEVLQKKEESKRFIGNYHKILNEFKRELVEEALKKANNNRKEAAKLLGITPQALGYIIRELKMVK